MNQRSGQSIDKAAPWYRLSDGKAYTLEQLTAYKASLVEEVMTVMQRLSETKETPWLFRGERARLKAAWTAKTRAIGEVKAALRAINDQLRRESAEERLIQAGQLEVGNVADDRLLEIAYTILRKVRKSGAYEFDEADKAAMMLMGDRFRQTRKATLERGAF